MMLDVAERLVKRVVELDGCAQHAGAALAGGWPRGSYCRALACPK
jgi:hypothetical protein